jgi:outer membrane receptor protein involved in Fe transport
LTTELNFDLPPEAVQVPQVVIVAERPLIKKDQTNTLRIQTSEELNTLPIRGTTNFVALQASVVKNEGSNLLYIRGGRSEEVSYLVDGVTVNNPLSGNASPAFNYINQNAIEELQIQTGGFNAEYGAAMSGVINLNTKQGGTKYTAAAEVITDHYHKTKVGEFFLIILANACTSVTVPVDVSQ